MYASFRVALFCGLLPLITGISIFVLWLITGWLWLEVAGFFTILGGTALVIIGMGALGYFCREANRESRMSCRRLWFSRWAAPRLFSNFPVAAEIIATVNAIEKMYTVVIHNTSRGRLSKFVGGGCDKSLGTISAGADARCSLSLQCDGKLEFRAISGTATHSEIIQAHVAHGTGGQAVVTVAPDGTISVSLSVALINAK